MSASQETVLTESVSEKGRLGRPPAFTEDYLAVLRSLYPDVRSRRGLVNIAYRQRAIEALRDRPDCQWLCDFPAMQRGDSDAWKPTLLTELGRIADVDTLLAVARWLCTVQPTTRDAVRLVRQSRVKPQPPRENQLADEIIDTINRYLARYPATPWGHVRHALDVAQVGVHLAEEGDPRVGLYDHDMRPA